MRHYRSSAHQLLGFRDRPPGLLENGDQGQIFDQEGGFQVPDKTYAAAYGGHSG